MASPLSKRKKHEDTMMKMMNVAKGTYVSQYPKGEHECAVEKLPVKHEEKIEPQPWES